MGEGGPDLQGASCRSCQRVLQIAQGDPAQPKKEAPAVGDMTAGALSLTGAFVTAMRAPAKANARARRRQSARLKFWRCDISAEERVRSGRQGGSVRAAVGASRALRMTRWSGLLGRRNGLFNSQIG